MMRRFLVLDKFITMIQNSDLHKKRIKKRNRTFLFFFSIWAIILFSVGFIRVKKEEKTELKKTTFKSLNDIFTNKNPMKKNDK
jgi:hypothetical protein